MDPEQETALSLSACPRRCAVALAFLIGACTDGEVAPTAPLASVSLSASFDAAHTIELSDGGSIQLHSSLAPNPYHGITWTTSDPNVADVNAWFGVIYAHSDGVATVSASNGSETEAFQVRVGA